MTSSEVSRSQRLSRIARWIGFSGFAVCALSFIVSIAAAATSDDSALRFLGVYGIGCFVVGICIWLFIKTAAAGPTPTRAAFWVRIGMTTLALIAPLAVVVAFRLSFEMCIILNPLGLPWTQPVKTVARIVSAAAIVVSTVMLIWGSRRHDLKGASLVLAKYSAAIAVPTILVLFLTVYGDPGPSCVVG